LSLLKEELYKAETTLNSHNIPDARFEAELLLMHTLGIGKAELYVRLEQTLDASAAEEFWTLIRYRLHHEPTAYILKQCQFYGIDFYIDSRALIPRPESELLVEEVLEFTRQRFTSGDSYVIADVGTGSGALAIALALHLPQAEIYAIDISEAALEVARINCQKHKVNRQIHLLAGDMLHPLGKEVNIIVANLPYVSDLEMNQLSPEIKDYEPRIALAGGADGLDKICQLFPQAEEKLCMGGLLLLEIGQGQGKAGVALAEKFFPAAKIDLIPDLGGVDRVVRVKI